MAPEGPADRQPDPAATSAQGDCLQPDHLLACAMAFLRSALLLSAHDLGLFAALAAGPRDAASLERRLGLRQDLGGDFLDALVGLGLLEQCGCQYRNTPEASRFLDPTNAAYIGPWLAMASAALRHMRDLTTRLRAPGAEERVQSSPGESLWAEIDRILRAHDTHDEG